MDVAASGYVAYVTTSWYTTLVLRVLPSVTTARALLSASPAPHQPRGRCSAAGLETDPLWCFAFSRRRQQTR